MIALSLYVYLIISMIARPFALYAVLILQLAMTATTL